MKTGKMNWRICGHVASGMFVGSCDLLAKGVRHVANMMYGFQNMRFQPAKQGMSAVSHHLGLTWLEAFF